MVKKIKLTRLCPICNTDRGQLLHNQTFSKLEGSPLPYSYNLVECLNCGFVFADTYASQDDYNMYYSDMSKYEDASIASGSAFNQNDYDRLLRTSEVIEKFIDKDSSILDMGCANGGLLKILFGRGYSDLTGIDPSKICVRNVLNLGIPSLQMDLFSDSFSNLERKFDFIILSHVLEHIRDTQKAIKILAGKLSENGKIYIEVPDASRYNDFFIVPFYYIDIEHINHFSPVSLGNIFRNLGFQTLLSEQTVIKLKEKTEYPVLYSVFERSPVSVQSIIVDRSASKGVTEFLKASKESNTLDTTINSLIASQEELIIWGAGQFALRLLSTSNLSEANIIGFVDSDKTKQSKKISGYNVYPPDFISDKKCTLLICSAIYAEDILNAARKLNQDIRYRILA
jgi:SAM-dependent methyltransferase